MPVKSWNMWPRSGSQQPRVKHENTCTWAPGSLLHPKCLIEGYVYVNPTGSPNGNRSVLLISLSSSASAPRATSAAAKEDATAQALAEPLAPDMSQVQDSLLQTSGDEADPWILPRKHRHQSARDTRLKENGPAPSTLLADLLAVGKTSQHNVGFPAVSTGVLGFHMRADLQNIGLVTKRTVSITITNPRPSPQR